MHEETISTIGKMNAEFEFQLNNLKDILTKKDIQISLQEEKLSSIEKTNAEYYEAIEALKEKERVTTEVLLLLLLLLLLLYFY